MDLTRKFALLACLYIAQGLPYGFFTQALPALLRDQGMSLEVIGLAVFLALPWAIKFLWAPLLDKYGTRKRWIVAANLCAVLCMLGMSMVPLSELVSNAVYVLFAGFFLMNLFTATQDIATDGMAVSRLSEQERGLGNGIQVAGYRVGMILGGGLLLAWFTAIGWQYSMWILALMMFAFTLPAFFMRQHDHHVEQEKLSLSDFVGFIKLPHLTLWLLVLLSYKFGDYLSGTMVRPMMVDMGLSIDDIALMMGSVGFTAGLFGALFGGWWIQYLGRFKALVLFGVLQAFACGAWVLLPLGYDGLWLMYGLSALEHFVGGLATAALFTVMMDHCRPVCAGSDYTVQSCIVVLMNMVAAGLSGVSAANLGYTSHFILSGAVGLIALPLIIRYRRHLLS